MTSDLLAEAVEPTTNTGTLATRIGGVLYQSFQEGASRNNLQNDSGCYGSDTGICSGSAACGSMIALQGDPLCVTSSVALRLPRKDYHREGVQGSRESLNLLVGYHGEPKVNLLS